MLSNIYVSQRRYSQEAERMKVDRAFWRSCLIETLVTFFAQFLLPNLAYPCYRTVEANTLTLAERARDSVYQFCRTARSCSLSRKYNCSLGYLITVTVACQMTLELLSTLSTVARTFWFASATGWRYLSLLQTFKYTRFLQNKARTNCLQHRSFSAWKRVVKEEKSPSMTCPAPILYRTTSPHKWEGLFRHILRLAISLLTPLSSLEHGRFSDWRTRTGRQS